MRFGLRRVLTVAMIFAVLVLALGSCHADRLVLGTDPGALAGANGAERRLVESEVGLIECWVARSPGAKKGRPPEAFVLFIPGKGSRADGWTSVVADAWGERAVEVWGVNYPGFGGTAGPAALARVGPTAVAAHDALARAAGGRPIFLQAASFGTAAALHVSVRREVAGLILHKPPPLRELILGRYGWWNLWLLAWPVSSNLPDDLDSIANGGRSRSPAVFLLHGADGITPIAYQRQVVAAYAGIKRVIEMPGAGHDAPLTSEAAEGMRVAIGWLWTRAVGIAKER